MRRRAGEGGGAIAFPRRLRHYEFIFNRSQHPLVNSTDLATGKQNSSIQFVKCLFSTF
jgi:hypothetical protein